MGATTPTLTHVYASKYTYIHVNIHMSIYTSIHLNVHMCTHQYTSVHTSICTCIRINIHMCTHVSKKNLLYFEISNFIQYTNVTLLIDTP